MKSQWIWNSFRITRMGFFDSGLTLTLGPSETVRNTELLQLCRDMEQKTKWKWQVASVSPLSGGENVSEELRRYGMPIQAQIPLEEMPPDIWSIPQNSLHSQEEDATIYLYESGVGLLSITTCFSSETPISLGGIESQMTQFMDWKSPAYFPEPLWMALAAFREIAQGVRWKNAEVRELERLDHFTTATKETPVYLVYLICILDNVFAADQEQLLLKDLSQWVSDTFASEQPVIFEKFAEGLHSAISWDVTVVLTQDGSAGAYSRNVVHLLEMIHYFWYLIYMTDSLLNRKIRELETMAESGRVEIGIRQLRAFRIHIWRTMDNFRLVKLSMLPLHMFIFEIARREWKIDQIEASIVDKLNFLDTVYIQLRDELQEHRQSNLNLIALLFTVITFASAVASIIATYDFDNTQFSRLVRAIALASSPLFAALASWLILAIISYRRRHKN